MSLIKRTNDDLRVLMAEQKASGQTQEAWCAANGVNIFTFQDRASRLRRLDREAANTADSQGATSAG